MRARQIFILSFLAIFFFPLFLNAQISVTKIDESFKPGSKDGFIYALPQTLVEISVTVQQKELLAGPLRNYAEEYLGITNVISQNGFEYSIKDIRLATIAEADPQQYYYVNLEEKSSRENWQSLVNLNGYGMITALGVWGDGAENESGGVSSQLSQDEVMELFRHYADLNMYAKVDTIVRTINIDTITIEDYTFRTVMTDKPLEVKAEETAKMIQKIREGRYNLLTGYQEVNYSEGALRFMNDELLQLEADYLRLFAGAVITKDLTYTFTYLPTQESNGSSATIFRISATAGISEGDGPGQPVSIQVSSSGSTAALQQANGSNDMSSGAASNGFYYRIPEEATIKVSYRGNTAAQMRAPVGQFGLVSALPAAAMDVEFDGKTGGIKSMKLEAE